MEIFIIGATGFVGGAVARHLAGAGHHITGLARTETAAAALEADGINPVAGDLEARLPETFAAARLADTVIYTAAADPAQETATLDNLIQALADSGKTLVFLSGTGVFLQRTAGAWSEDSFAEEDPFTVEPLAAARKAVEATMSPACSPWPWTREPQGRSTTQWRASPRIDGSRSGWPTIWDAVPAVSTKRRRPISGESSVP
ncbi:NAD(P)H-binding protein [Streptomyces sp. NPDC059455]|uniref:NAD(P)H-binding protein n=1 Tax=Streptomyces sp. NPDC059455 TaxID=3346837 RepID=UPI0036C14EBF